MNEDRIGIPEAMLLDVCSSHRYDVTGDLRVSAESAAKLHNLAPGHLREHAVKGKARHPTASASMTVNVVPFGKFGKLGGFKSEVQRLLMN